MKLNALIEGNITFLKVILYILVLSVVILKGPEHFPDSYAHMDMLINRSVIYSLIINIPNVLFGDYNGYTIIIIHFTAFVLSLEYFLRQSKKFLGFSNTANLLLIFTFCFLAIFIYPFMNTILSEGIAFPLLMTGIGMLIKLWQDISTKQLAYFAICFFLLMLTRSQFIVLLPLFLLLFLMKYKTVVLNKSAIIMVAVILTTPILSKLTEKLYYNLVLNENIGYTMTYVHLISAPFYVCTIDDQSLFSNEEERLFFIRTKRLLDDKKLSYSYAKSNNLDEFDYYQNNFTSICNTTIHEANLAYYESQGFTYYNQHRKVDEITKRLFLPLLKKSFVKWLVVVIKGFKKGLGRSYGILVVTMIIFLSLLFYQYGFREVSIFFLGILILQLSLHLLIAISVHSIQRYLFYFQWVTPMFLLVVGDRIIVLKKLSYK